MTENDKEITLKEFKEAKKQSDLEIVLKLQRDYDELQEDCKQLLNVILNLKGGKPAPTLIEYNDTAGWPATCDYLIREHATWNVKPKTEENEQV